MGKRFTVGETANEMIALQRPAQEYFGGEVRDAAAPLHLVILDMGTYHDAVSVRTP